MILRYHSLRPWRLHKTPKAKLWASSLPQEWPQRFKRVQKLSKIHSARSSCTEFLSNLANMIKHVDPLATDSLLRVRDSKSCPWDCNAFLGADSNGSWTEPQLEWFAICMWQYVAPVSLQNATAVICCPFPSSEKSTISHISVLSPLLDGFNRIFDLARGLNFWRYLTELKWHREALTL